MLWFIKRAFRLHNHSNILFNSLDLDIQICYLMFLDSDIYFDLQAEIQVNPLFESRSFTHFFPVAQLWSAQTPAKDC